MPGGSPGSGGISASPVETAPDRRPLPGEANRARAHRLPALRAPIMIPLPDTLQQQARGTHPHLHALNGGLEQAFESFRNGEVDKAVAACRKEISLNASCAEAHHLMGVICHQAGRLETAAGHFRQAVAEKPGSARMQAGLGQVLQQLGDTDGAYEAYRRSLALGMRSAWLYNNLGLVEEKMGRLSAAAETLRQALLLDPRQAQSHYNLGNVYRRQWRLGKAIDAYAQALAIRPDYARAHANLLFALNYSTAHDNRTVADAHRQWARRHADPLMPGTCPEPRRAPSGDRRLRIGYVSGDFRFHPVSFFVEPLLACHNHDEFHITAYDTNGRPDAVTRRLRRFTDCWRDMDGASDAALKQRIEADGIHILVDLMGHTAGNRLALFARKPAPVQVTYLGYPNTTGMSAMDYRLTDAWADPAGSTESLYTEKLVRLPGAFCCYRPPVEAPDVGPLPARKNGSVTFGCFNDPLRINPPLIAVWADILKALPGSRLLLQNRPPDDAGVAERIRRRFSRLGIDPQRVGMAGYKPFRDHLMLYGEVDIALDTYPFNGHTNTCHALWMGVPVVTRAGGNYISRMGASLLNCIGLPELITASRRTYVSVAVELARNLSLLEKLRSALRPLITRSGLTDAVHFTRGVESAFRKMWQDRCDAGTPAL